MQSSQISGKMNKKEIGVKYGRQNFSIFCNYFIVASFIMGFIPFIPFAELISFLGAPFCFLIQFIIVVRSFIKGEENAKYKLLVFIFLFILAFCKIWFPHYNFHAHTLFEDPHLH